MDCKQVEELMSMYIECEVSEELQRDISLHLEQCAQCRELKEEVEELLYVFPDLEEDVPFFLKNRLYYIPESQEVEIISESNFNYVKWVAAAIGTFVLFLNMFYFTNIYPPANRLMHTAVSKVETFAVQAGAFFEKVKESKNLMIFSIFKSDKDKEDDTKKTGDEKDPDNEKEKKITIDKPSDKSIDKNIDKNNDGSIDKNKKSDETSDEEEKNKKLKTVKTQDTNSNNGGNNG
jgi:Putative zinc-finger